MNKMEIVRTGNIIEGFFWLLVSLFFLAPALRPKEKNRWFCLYGAAIFIIFAGSDFYEAQTGAWWEPWWLILWNAGCVAGIILMVLWYVKINGSVAATLEKLRRPILSRRKNSQS